MKDRELKNRTVLPKAGYLSILVLAHPGKEQFCKQLMGKSVKELML